MVYPQAIIKINYKINSNWCNIPTEKEKVKLLYFHRSYRFLELTEHVVRDYYDTRGFGYSYNYTEPKR